ncbi:MAG TPA: hypothetical protein VGD40_21035 [Chryseosolibacter sp.]
MKTLATIAAITFSAISFTAWSQAGDKKEKELDKTQESQRARSTQGVRTDNELKDDRGEVQSNEYRPESRGDSTKWEENEKNDDQQSPPSEVIEPNPDQGLGSDDDGNGLTEENNTTQGGEQNEAPAVIQRTSSESGSPAVLSEDNGRKRDGTNNVQRATPNIAGAKEPGNMNLSEKNVGERNRNTGAETKTREQEHTPARIPSKKEQQTDKATVEAQQQQDVQSGEMKQTTTTGEEPKTALSAKEERKLKRKNRRERRKGQ